MKALLRKGIPCLVIALLLSTALFAQSSSVTIGPGAVKTNSVLWLVPTGGQGLLLPALTTGTRTGMNLNATDDKGMIVYDNQLNKMFFWNGTAWVDCGGGTGTNQTLTLAGNTFTLSGSPSSNANLASNTPTTGQALVWNGTAWTAASLSGDVTGATSTTQVAGLKGKLLPTLPGTAQALVYDGTNWIFQTIGSGAGEANTASNVGTSGVGVFKQKTGVNLEFQKINAGSNVISVTQDVPNSEVDINVNQANLSIASTQVTGLGTLSTLSVVGTAQITDLSITNADIAAAAAIAVTKLAAGTNGQVLTTTAGVPTWGALGGLSILNAVGSTEITDGTVSSADILNGTIAATDLAAGAVSGGAAGTITDGSIINADIAAAAAIDISKLNSGGAGNNGLVLKVVAGALTFANDDVGGGATPTLATGQILVGNGATNSAVAVSGDLTMNNGAFQIAPATVAAAELAAGSVSGGAAGTIADGTIINADIAAAAAVAVTKLAAGTNGQVLTTTAGVPTWAALGGLSILNAVGSTEITDGTVSSADILNGTIVATDLAAGAVSGGAAGTITDGSIINADIAAAAAIDISKLNSGGAGNNGLVLKVVAGALTFASDDVGAASPTLATGQMLVGNGATNSAVAVSGDLTMNNGIFQIAAAAVGATELAAGSVSGGAAGTITDGTIINADIAAAAAVAVTKLAAGTNGQVLTTTAGVPTWAALGGLSILNAVGSTEITDGSVTSADILNGTIAATDLAAGAVSGGAAGTITDASITSADLAAGSVSGGAAGTITDGSITNADISGTAAIGVTKLAAGANTQVLTTVAGVPTWSTPVASTDNQDLELAGTTLSLTNDGTSVNLGDLAILDAVTLTTSQVSGILPVANGGTGRATWDGLLLGSGATINDVSTGTNGQILRAAGGAPSWADFLVTTTEIVDGTIAAVDMGVSSVSGGAAGTITDGTIVNADLSATAAIAVTKLAAGANTQVLTTVAGVPTWAAAGAGSALVTNNVIPKGNGAAQVASSLTDNATTLSTTNDFNIATGKSYMINNADVLRTTGATNAALFVGENSGPATTGMHNTFVGIGTGNSTTTGTDNTFVGRHAGFLNVTESYNVFIGKNAGYNTTDNGLNTYVGWSAGYRANATQGGNTFLGAEAGSGPASGLFNTASYNTFLGEQSGLINTTGEMNTLVGRLSGAINETGSRLTLIGHQADILTAGTNLSNAAAIGYQAKVSANNSFILGGTGASAVNVGIGLTAATTDLHVVHANVGTGADGFTLQNIGANNESWTFFVSNSTGNLNLFDNFTTLRGQFDDSNGNYTVASDRRLKKNIRAIESVLPKISNMQIRRYHFKKQDDSEQTNIGVIAQELKEVFPELVKYSPEADIYTVDYTSLGTIAIKAIQEQQAMIDDLKKKVDELEASLKKEKSSNQELTSKIENLADDIDYIKRSVGLDQKAKK